MPADRLTPEDSPLDAAPLEDLAPEDTLQDATIGGATPPPPTIQTNSFSFGSEVPGDTGSSSSTPSGKAKFGPIKIT